MKLKICVSFLVVFCHECFRFCNFISPLLNCRWWWISWVCSIWPNAFLAHQRKGRQLQSATFCSAPRESHNNGAFALFISGVAGKEERSAKKRRPLAHRKSTQRPFSFFPLGAFASPAPLFAQTKALRKRELPTLLLLINFDTYSLND